VVAAVRFAQSGVCTAQLETDTRQVIRKPTAVLLIRESNGIYRVTDKNTLQILAYEYSFH
jgi:hypothetical protein